MPEDRKTNINNLIIVWQGQSWSTIAPDGRVLGRFPNKRDAFEFAKSNKRYVIDQMLVSNYLDKDFIEFADDLDDLEGKPKGEQPIPLDGEWDEPEKVLNWKQSVPTNDDYPRNSSRTQQEEKHKRIPTQQWHKIKKFITINRLAILVIFGVIAGGFFIPNLISGFFTIGSSAVDAIQTSINGIDWGSIILNIVFVIALGIFALIIIAGLIAGLISFLFEVMFELLGSLFECLPIIIGVGFLLIVLSFFAILTLVFPQFSGR